LWCRHGCKFHTRAIWNGDSFFEKVLRKLETVVKIAKTKPETLMASPQQKRVYPIRNGQFIYVKRSNTDIYLNILIHLIKK